MAPVYPLLARTRLVLIHPTLPENVGSVARAMRHFGLAELVLVGGVSPVHSLARAAGAGSDEVLEAARVVDTLDQALQGVVLALGTTARPQPTIERRPLLPDEGARLALATVETGPVALVFGTEKSGMTNAELRRCDQLLTIPHTASACLNLAQAATIFAHAWHMAALAPPPSTTPLSAAAHAGGLPALADTLADALLAAGILKATDEASKRHALRRILSAAPLSADDAALITGLARAYASRSLT